MARRKKNPSPLAIGAGLAVAAGVGYMIYEETKGSKKTAGKTSGGGGSGVSPLSGYYTPGSTLSNSESTLAKVVLPVLLSFEPDVRNPENGEISPAGTKDITLVSPQLLPNLVTNLTPRATEDAFKYMEDLIATKGLNLENPVVRDQAIQETLNKTGARKVDWSKGLSPYTFGSSEFNVWQGVQLLGELAYGTYINKAAMG